MDNGKKGQLNGLIVKIYYIPTERTTNNVGLTVSLPKIPYSDIWKTLTKVG